MKLLFLDESGDHNLQKLDPANPVFVLGGVIVDRTYARTEMRERIRQFKVDFFGNPDLVLHTTDIARARNGFEALSDPIYRAAFVRLLNTLMVALEYRVVACVINKARLVKRDGQSAADPYHYALHVLIERFCKELSGSFDGGMIYAEKRGEPLDYNLNFEWERLRLPGRGTRFADAETIDACICELVIKEKKLNIEGLQLADLVIGPIARKARRLPVYEDWDIVKSKFRRGPDGQWKGFGLVYLPRVNQKAIIARAKK